MSMSKAAHVLCYKKVTTGINYFYDDIFCRDLNFVFLRSIVELFGSLNTSIGVLRFGIGNCKGIVSKGVEFAGKQLL